MLAIRCACGVGRRAAFSSVNSAVGGRRYSPAAYEGEGKTTVTVLNNNNEVGIMIDAYSNLGFRLNNGVTIVGPMALFPRTVLSWQVKTGMDVTEDSLRLFTLLEPKIDLLIISLEAKSKELTEPVLRAAARLKLNVELLETQYACATFNFLTIEGRSVAAAMIPPYQVSFNEDDILESKMRYQKLFKKPLLESYHDTEK